MSPDVLMFDPGDTPPVSVGAGCIRRDMVAPDGVRVWIVEISAGSQWPRVDIHDETGEVVMVLAGELIEGDRRFPAGSYLLYPPHSRHRPRTETGVRLFGFNLTPERNPS